MAVELFEIKAKAVVVDEVKTCCDVDHSKHDQFVEETDRWDKVGVALSGLCAIHCLVTPLLALAVPVLGEMFEQPWVHILMALFVVPVGLFAFYSGYRHHKKKYILAMGCVGLALVGAGLSSPFIGLGFSGHDVLTISGSIFLITAHTLNRRACLCHQH